MARTILFAFLGIMVAACAAGAQSSPSRYITEPVSIFNRTWQWEATIIPVEKITVSNPERYTIKLNENGKAQIRFDCNLGSGDFKISGNELSFGPLISTQMVCSEDSLDAVFMRDLQGVVSFFTKDETLFLELKFDSGTMRFRPEVR